MCRRVARRFPGTEHMLQPFYPLDVRAGELTVQT